MRSRGSVVHSKWLLAFLALMLTLIATACGSGSSSTSGGASQKTYHFVVSNNFLGNDWRPQVERLAQLTTNYAPFKGRVSIEVVNAENTDQAQIQSLGNIIQAKPDAIMLIPSSSTALNPTIKRACNAHILVFTISAPVTEPCAWNVNQDFYGGMKAVGRWMGQVLHDKGNIFVDRGISGLGISDDIRNGFLAGLKQDGPNVKAVAEFDGQYAQGPEQSGISNLLVAHPDINGIMTQGYCTPVFNALQQAGKSPVPATCYAYNGELSACAQPGHQCAILSGSPVVMQIAMKEALDVLDGKANPPKDKIIPVPMTLYITAEPKVQLGGSGVDVQVLQAGKNFFPDLPPGLALPFTLDQFPITAQQAAGK